MSAKPLKEAELRALAKCSACGRKIGQIPLPVFWKVTMERHCLDIAAVKRQQGLTDFFTGGPAGALLASVMGPNEDMTAVMADQCTVMVCDECACHRITLAVISEAALAQAEG